MLTLFRPNNRTFATLFQGKEKFVHHFYLPILYIKTEEHKNKFCVLMFFCQKKRMVHNPFL